MGNNYTRRRTQLHQFKETARIDPYRSTAKPQGTPQCPKCKVINIKGRWIPEEKVKAAQPTLSITGDLECPACRQLHDRFAQGVVEFHGERWKEKRDLIMNTVRNTESILRNRNDQERILWNTEIEGVTKIYVTLPELARQIGRELERSFHGITEYEHSDQEPFVRVKWMSDVPHIKHSPGSSFSLKEEFSSNEEERPKPGKSKSRRRRGEEK